MGAAVRIATLMMALLLSAGALSAQQRDAERWAALLDNPSNTIRQAAVDSLGRAGAAAVPPLVLRLTDSVQDRRYWAAVALTRVGPAGSEAVPALITALLGSDRAVRTRAAAALGAIGASSVLPLTRVVADSATQFWGAMALSRLGPHLEPALPALVTALDHGDAVARAEVILAIGEWGRPVPAAIPGMVRALAIADPWLRTRAAIILPQMGADARAALPALQALLGDPNPDVRARAAEAIAAIREPRE